MTKTKRAFLVFFVLVFSPIVAFSQISWQEILPWQIETPKDTEYYALNSLSSSNTNNTTIVGYVFHNMKFPYLHCSHLIIRTTDGGSTWKEQISGLPDFLDDINDMKIEKVFAIDSLNVVAVGDSGLILRTTDAGNTWLRQRNKMNTKLRDVSFSDPGHGIAVGDYGTVCITSDGGNSWNVHSMLTNSYFHLTKAFKNGCYFVFSFYNLHLFRTFDGGQTWDSLPIINRSLKDSLWTFIEDIHFFDSLSFIAVGGHQNPQGIGSTTSHYYAIKTTDGGENWKQLIDSSSVLSPLLSVSFFDGLIGVASSSYGNLIVTNDGGNNWVTIFTDTLSQISLTGVFYRDRKHLYAFGNRTFYSSLLEGTYNGDAVAADDVEKPNDFTIFPNPISSEIREMRISFTLGSESNVIFSIYDVLGRQVRKSDIGYNTPGSHQFIFDASLLPADNYYAVLEAEGKRLTKQILILR